MKPAMKTVLRTAAWSASGLLMLGAVAGTADAATHHKKSKASADSTDTSGAPAAHPQMLHDIATVENSDGTFEEYASQFGKVSAISATSIKVVSDDEYSATYAIDEDTVVLKDGKKATTDDVAVGDQVFVRAEDEDGTSTAQVIGDGKPPRQDGPGGGHRPPGGPGGPGGPGAPGAPGEGGPGAPGGSGSGTDGA
ncbi:MAG TPA: DUF5666 domain-containing protein [Mycobacteriales bacterium]|nr:DUF5666 domain-containing protein [Mycobacteriales bacterium]